LCLRQTHSYPSIPMLSPAVNGNFEVLNSESGRPGRENAFLEELGFTKGQLLAQACSSAAVTYY
jgi:hypothetical protein